MIKVIASIYEIIEEIGAGGGGRVYLAFHRRLGKKVILKAEKSDNEGRFIKTRSGYPQKSKQSIYPSSL